MPVVVAAGLGAFLLTLAIGLYFLFQPSDVSRVIIADITVEGAQKTIEQISAVSKTDRTYEQNLSIGNAYARMGLVKDALDAYEVAAKLGDIPTDSSPLRYAIEQLGDPLLSDTAIRVMQSYRGQHIDQALARALESEVLMVRRNALRTMQRRGSSTVVQQVDVAIRDLLSAPSCEERRQGLTELSKVASGSDVKRTLEAIAKVEQRPGHPLNSCMVADLAPAKQRIIER